MSVQSPVSIFIHVLGWVPLFRLGRVVHHSANLWQRIYHNRRNPTERLLFVRDVILNVQDEWHCFVHRIPAGSLLEKGESGQARSHWTRVGR